MTEPNRSFWLGDRATSWEDLPRWQQLVGFWAAFLLAVGFCLKVGQMEAWLILSSAALAGRIGSTLFELKPAGRGSERSPSVVQEL